MDLREKIQKAVGEAVQKAFNLQAEVKIERPKDESHGDYSSNIALVLSKELKQNPLEIAEKIKTILQSPTFVEKVEVVVPGFINFRISPEFLLESVGQSNIPQVFNNQKILVEFAHPNTHKEFHIGHLRNISTGESISRLLEKTGAIIKRVNYQGDVGMHVAKALYGVGKLGKELEAQEKETPQEKAKFLGKAYALGSKFYEEDEKAKEEIGELNKKIYSMDKTIVPLWEKTRKWSLEYFDSIYKRVYTVFERLYFESEVYEVGKNIVLSHIVDGVFAKSEGAVIFDGEKYGLHKRVFITSEGNPTYEGKEMGLGVLQYEEFPFDQAFHVVGPEQAGYFKVVFKALELVNPALKGKGKHLAYGFVRLKDGKMSSRMGNIISGEWLLDEAKSRIKKEFSEMGEEVAEQVAVGAVKYSMLKFGRESDIAFSFEESISLNGNSGPYLQYTYARTQSVLAKSQIPASPAGRSNLKSQNTKKQNDQGLKLTASEKSADAENPMPKAFTRGPLAKLQKEELSLVRILARFEEVVGEAAEGFAPNVLASFLFDLAQKFNLFYQKHKVIGSEQEEFRLFLTQKTGETLKQGLSLLGIESPEKM